MKRTYKFEEDDQAYRIYLDEIEKYEINKDNLKVDGTKFYETFFYEYSIGDSIEIIKGETVNSNNKLSLAVFDTIDKLIQEISQKINEQEE